MVWGGTQALARVKISPGNSCVQPGWKLPVQRKVVNQIEFLPGWHPVTLNKSFCCFQRALSSSFLIREKIQTVPNYHSSSAWQMSKDLEKNGMLRLPWWRSGWESACQYRGHGFEPWSGKIPHAAEQLGPWATTTEPVRLKPVLRNKRGHDSERPVHHDEEWSSPATTRESPRTETKTQHSNQSINQSI